MTHVKDGTGDEPGLARGTSAVDANTKVLTLSQTLDTNDDAGLSGIGGSPTLELTDTGRLKLTITGEEIALFDRLPLQGLSKNPATPLR
jgi:Flp pilus assembly protein CpaB